MEKGSAFLLKVGDGATPPQFTTVAGLRTTQMSINAETVVVTNQGSGRARLSPGCASSMRNTPASAGSSVLGR